VVGRLKGLAASVEAKEALVRHQEEEFAAATNDFEQAEREEAKAEDKLKNVDVSNATALGEAKDAVDKAAAKLQKAEARKNRMAEALKQAEDSLLAAKEENTVQNLAAAASDFSDLQAVPDFCTIPSQCEQPPKIDCEGLRR